MPSKFSISVRSFFGRTLKKMSSKKALAPRKAVVVTNMYPIVTMEGKIEGGIEEAYHDPTVLDVRRSMRFGLNNCFMEFTKIAVPVASSVISSYISSPPSSPEPPSEPGTPALTLDSSSAASSTPELGTTRELALKDLKLLKLLSQGSSGQVFATMDRVTRERRALKVIPHAGKTNREILMLLEEQMIMRSLNELDCPFHLKLDASFCDTRNFYLAMPLHPTDIESEIVRCGKLDIERARFYFVETYIALVRLHKDGIIHRDVKPGNILIDAEGHIVLADFGLAFDFNEFPTLAERLFQPYWPFARGDVVTGPETPHRRPEELSFVTDSRCGTILHMSPEVVCGKPYSFPADVWALAVSLYMMVTGRAPFDTDLEGFDDMKEEILKSEVVFLPEDGVSECTQDFIRRMLEKEPHNRLRLTELEEHPFFAGVNWPLFEQRLVQPPWIPGREPTHLYHTKAREFIPGVSFDASSPYLGFEYISDDVAVGVIRPQDVIDPADEPDEYCANAPDFSLELKAPPTRVEKIKAFFEKLVNPKQWFRKSTFIEDPCLKRLGAAFGEPLPPRSSPYAYDSSDSAPWASIQLNRSNPVAPRSSNPTCVAYVPTCQGLLSSIRAWFSRLRIPRAYPVPKNGLRFDLLS
ncbi:hypothetical protein H0H87_012171 [Tephrocybe sp. NHM501043]|nr:hypothetical protein H0H87_012171 [Tephrocybe sp. NHM501043]